MSRTRASRQQPGHHRSNPHAEDNDREGDPSERDPGEHNAGEEKAEPSPAGAWADARGVRFTAWVTSIVLTVGLVTANAWVIFEQAALFGLCAACGVRVNPVGVFYRRVLASRRGRPTQREPVAPLRFAQAVGCILGLTGAVGYASGASTVGALAVALALTGCLLNALTGWCLGCQLYVLATRLHSRHHASTARRGQAAGSARHRAIR